MTLIKTVGMFPTDYQTTIDKWLIGEPCTPSAIVYRAELLVRIDKTYFSLDYNPNEGYSISFQAGADIFECMWVATHLHWIFKKPFKTKMNGTVIEWRMI